METKFLKTHNNRLLFTKGQKKIMKSLGLFKSWITSVAEWLHITTGTELLPLQNDILNY